MATLYIMCGVGFSGKSTLAKSIAAHTGAALVSQDALFFEKKEELDLDMDDESQWRMLLAMCKERIVENLTRGESVVFDNVNTKVKHRNELRKLAQSVGSDTKVIFLDTSLAVQKERQQKNKVTGERHDVKQEYLDQAISELEPPTVDENVLIFKPDTDLKSFLADM